MKKSYDLFSICWILFVTVAVFGLEEDVVVVVRKYSGQ